MESVGITRERFSVKPIIHRINHLPTQSWSFEPGIWNRYVIYYQMIRRFLGEAEQDAMGS
jgi:hypothetical protein